MRGICPSVTAILLWYTMKNTLLLNRVTALNTQPILLHFQFRIYCNFRIPKVNALKNEVFLFLGLNCRLLLLVLQR